MTTEDIGNIYGAQERSSSKSAISVVIPTFNEADNVESLVKRVDSSLNSHNIEHEIIFVDDHSNDGTVSVLERLRQRYPIRIYSKVGKRGKATSLLEGFDYARNPFVCMIDGDLEYPPEAIAPMAEVLSKGDADVIVSAQSDTNLSRYRRLTKRLTNLLLVKVLFGIDYESRHGLKVFRRDVLRYIDVKPNKWSFDLEFILSCLQNRFKILTFTVPTRNSRKRTKVRLFTRLYALLSLRLKIGRSHKKRSADNLVSLQSIKATFAKNSPKLQKLPSHNWLVVLLLVGALAFAVPLQASAARSDGNNYYRGSGRADNSSDDSGDSLNSTVSDTVASAAKKITPVTPITPTASANPPATPVATTTTTTNPGKGGGSTTSAPVTAPATPVTTPTTTPVSTSPPVNTTPVTAPAASVQAPATSAPSTPATSTNTLSNSATTPSVSQPNVASAQTASSSPAATSKSPATSAVGVSADSVAIPRPIAGAKTAKNLYPMTRLTADTTSLLKVSARALTYSGLTILIIGGVTVGILRARSLEAETVAEPYPHEHLKAALSR